MIMAQHESSDAGHEMLGEGGGNESPQSSDIEEEQQFDISLAASHSYMGSGLVDIRGRSVLEAGWEGKVPVISHHGVVFPGETVPMLLSNPLDAALLGMSIKRNKLFGLLFPDETGTVLSGNGVLCEIFEAGLTGRTQERATALTVKARAIHRFRLLHMPRRNIPIHISSRMRIAEVRVLPEVRPAEPLRNVRLTSLDMHRTGSTRQDMRLNKMDAAMTSWPLFVYEIFEYSRMRHTIQAYFKSIMLENLPEEPVSLSFWVASNLTLSPRDRLALFQTDSALQRLHMEVRFINRKNVLCCSACLNEIARCEHIFAMSSDGVHSNYTNTGGYMHDVVTVSRVINTEMSGRPSAEYSWFPGYTWTIALCLSCMTHVGWRFDAMKRNLRPQQFFGLCRNYVQPRCDSDLAERHFDHRTDRSSDSSPEIDPRVSRTF